MALEFEVKKHKVVEVFKLKYEENNEPKMENINILITYEEADELSKMIKNELTLERFAEILFKDRVDFIKEKTGPAYEDCVISVGFQLTTNLFKDKIAIIKSTSSMREFLSKK